MASSHVIRHSGWRDFGKLVELQKEIAHETEHFALTRGEKRDPFLYTLAKAILNRRRVVTFVAEDNRQLIGYITIIFGKFQKVRQTAYILMGVAASHRGQGIGTKLLQEAEDFAAKKGVHRIELEVFDRNDGAMRLYEKSGFEVEGRRREAIKTKDGYDDIIFMGKILGRENKSANIFTPESIEKASPVH